MWINTYLPLSFHQWFLYLRKWSLGFEKWADSMVSHRCMRWEGQEGALAQSRKSDCIYACSVSDRILNSCQILRISLKFIKTEIAFFCILFLGHCNQDFYFIITMHMVSSVLRIWYVIASYVNSAWYTEITVRLGIKCFQYILFWSNTLVPLAKSKSLSCLIQRWASLGTISFSELLSHIQNLCVPEIHSAYFWCVLGKGGVCVVGGWDIHDISFLEVLPLCCGKAMAC